MATAKSHETLILADKVDREHLRKIAIKEERTLKATIKRVIKAAYNKKFGSGSYNPEGVTDE